MIILGMGADGHVGSIYPNSDVRSLVPASLAPMVWARGPDAASAPRPRLQELLAEQGLILGVKKPDKLSVTMSLPLINAAQLVHPSGPDLVDPTAASHACSLAWEPQAPEGSTQVLAPPSSHRRRRVRSTGGHRGDG